MSSLPALEAISVFPEENPQSLLVMLHGWGANSRDLTGLVPMLDLPSMGYIFPNAPFEHPQVPEGRAWYSLETPGYEGIEQSREMLFNWLMSIESNTGIPISQTYVAGFSQGGAMTLDVALMIPFAGLVSMSGYLHYDPKPLETEAPPVLIVHGTQDAVVPLAAAQQARDKLSAINVAIDYQEFTMGHEIIPSEVERVQQFIRKNSSSSTSV